MTTEDRGLLPRPREGALGLLGAFVVAVVLHLLAFPTVHWISARHLVDAVPSDRGADFGRIAGAGLKKNRRIELDLVKPEAPRDLKEERKEDDDVVPPGQVVSLPPPEKQERPRTADYAAEHDQKVERETASRDARQRAPHVTRRLSDGSLSKTGSAEGGVALYSPGSAAESAGPAGVGRAAVGDSGTDPTDGRGQRAFALEIPRQAARPPVNVEPGPDGALRNRSAVPEIPGNGDVARIAIGRPSDAARRDGGGQGVQTGQGARGGGDGSPGTPTLAQLTPSPMRLAQLAGAPANDWLPEVETDAETRLNAWRWRHATFFNRIADAIRREWQGGEVLSQNDPAGRVYGFEDRMTVVQVTLDRQGNVIDIDVAEPSGAVVLDDEAVRAFKQAGPFANPPAALFRDGERFSFQFGFNISYNRSHFDLDWRP